MTSKSSANKGFTADDVRRLKTMGLSLGDVEKQLALYRRGPVFLKLKRPCRAGDGIVPFRALPKKKLISFFEQASPRYRLLKFVPASGAASRMFAAWFEAIENSAGPPSEFVKSFFRRFKKYPFSGVVLRDRRASRYLKRKDIPTLLHYTLSEAGLGLGALPKALIPFHLYGVRESRTALEEHIVEASSYLSGGHGVCHLHFTVSPEHQQRIEQEIKDVVRRYEKRFRLKYRISTSVQLPSTNTIAVDEFNVPARDSGGGLIFRPGGHGTLLQNLQDIDADFIFVKNIDNIVPERQLKKILPCKKILGGLAIRIQQQTFSYLRQLCREPVADAKLKEITDFAARTLHVAFPPGFSRRPSAEKKTFLFSMLNRPLRVCAVVRNEGEPGGAPFWVEEPDGRLTLQIVERAHVDQHHRGQWARWMRAEYFNPVDMVCCTKDYQGKKFHLKNYVNQDAYLITRKNEKGKIVNALEYPGLWNGCMARWNTVFVEMPLAIFNPVKTVEDLLRPQHVNPE